MGHAETKRIFSTHDAAKVCHVTPMTVIRWIEEGKIPAFKTVGGHRRILRSDLIAFCKGRGIPFDPDFEPAPGAILIVDGDSAARQVLAEMARTAAPGVTIALAADAFEAGRLIERMRPGLVFFDETLPGLAATEVGSRLSRDQETARMYVVVTGAQMSVEVSEALRSDGVAAAVLKPFDAGQVAAVIRTALGGGDPEPRTVLIACQDLGFAETLARSLETVVPGCRIIACDSAMDALLAVGSERPRLVLIDEALDGIEVTRRIHARWGDGITVAVMGTPDLPEREAEAIAAGARGYLAKPFSAETLVSVLGDDFIGWRGRPGVRHGRGRHGF